MKKTPQMKDDDQHYSAKETERRRDEAIKRALKTPPKTHDEMVKDRRTKESKPKVGR
jgi:hypothetical protein